MGKRSKFFVQHTLSISLTKLKTKLCGLSPRANYTDQATAACRPKLVSTFMDGVCRMVIAAEPHGCILGFLDQGRYYFFQVAPHVY
jgi:hypothetical protein